MKYLILTCLGVFLTSSATNPTVGSMMNFASETNNNRDALDTFESLIQRGFHRSQIASNTINENGQVTGKKVDGISVQANFQGDDGGKQCTLQIQNQDICEVNWNGLLEYIKPASEKIGSKDQELRDLKARFATLNQDKVQTDEALAEEKRKIAQAMDLLDVTNIQESLDEVVEIAANTLEAQEKDLKEEGTHKVASNAVAEAVFEGINEKKQEVSNLFDDIRETLEGR